MGGRREGLSGKAGEVSVEGDGCCGVWGEFKPPAKADGGAELVVINRGGCGSCGGNAEGRKQPGSPGVTGPWGDWEWNKSICICG